MDVPHRALKTREEILRVVEVVDAGRNRVICAFGGSGRQWPRNAESNDF